jgi:hypothetical protein
MKWLYAVLIFPAALTAQTYSACPTPGRSTLTVTAGNISTTKEITVVDIAAPAPVVDERYGYESIEKFTASPNTGKVYADLNNLQLEPECGALRSIFVPRTVNVCEKYYSGYDLKIPQSAGEIFVEMWVRFDPAFEPQRPLADSTTCRGTDVGFMSKWYQSGYVLALGRVDNNTGAFGVTLGTGYPTHIRAGSGIPSYFYVSDELPKQVDEDERHISNYGTLGWQYMGHIFKNNIQVSGGGYAMAGDKRVRDEFGNALMRFDGKWHRYRFWFKAANGKYPNGAGYGIWVDDDHLGSLPIQDTLADQMIGLSIGRFLWHQPQRQQHVDIGRVRIWTTNPGWDICQTYCMSWGRANPEPIPAELDDEPDPSCDPTDPECPLT